MGGKSSLRHDALQSKKGILLDLHKGTFRSLNMELDLQSLFGLHVT